LGAQNVQNAQDIVTLGNASLRDEPPSAASLAGMRLPDEPGAFQTARSAKNPRQIAGASSDQSKERPLASPAEVGALVDAITPRYRADGSSHATSRMTLQTAQDVLPILRGCRDSCWQETHSFGTLNRSLRQ
jgi:hypothetical protein